ncbi:MAG: ABC transporter ATP-binding protein [Flavobacteriales bacterium]|nr:ABC transporter ATP-binding protein [Flavobacteriales bacterium]
MITLRAVHKHFGRTQVLNGIDLEIGQGKVVSMLGPNGSGKSTLMKCLLDLVHPSSGEISIGGLPANNVEARKQISYMPQVARFAENISALRLFDFISDLRGEHPDPSWLIQHFALTEHVRKPLGDLSGGTRQKVSAVLAFLFDTPIIVLDEPTVGLDPVSRLKFKDLIMEKKAAGKTIFFTSHIMSDVEEVAEELIFLLEGRVVYQGAPATLLHQTGQENLEHAIAHILKQEEA